MATFMLVRALVTIIEFYSGLIVVWALLSWFPLTPGGLVSDIREGMGRLVVPYLSLFQRFIPPLGGIDFSPIVALAALTLLERVVIAIIY